LLLFGIICAISSFLSFVSIRGNSIARHLFVSSLPFSFPFPLCSPFKCKVHFNCFPTCSLRIHFESNRSSTLQTNARLVYNENDSLDFGSAVLTYCSLIRRQEQNHFRIQAMVACCDLFKYRSGQLNTNQLLLFMHSFLPLPLFFSVKFHCLLFNLVFVHFQRSK
jgi:hypothetical protein